MSAWLFGSWYDLLPQPWLAVALAMVAMVSGAIVGIEREKKEKAAGLRTLTLVCVGSAVFTMISIGLGASQGDPGRIAAQVVTGIGFLGAGAILRGERGVQGLTTAATIWAAAATGMTIGFGHPVAGVALSAGIVAVLFVAGFAERRYIGPCTMARATVTFDNEDGKGAIRVESILDAHFIPTAGRSAEKLESGGVRLQLSYCSAHKHHKDFLANLAALEEVRRIER